MRWSKRLKRSESRVDDPLAPAREMQRIIRNLAIWLACDHCGMRPSDLFCGICGARLQKKGD